MLQRATRAGMRRVGFLSLCVLGSFAAHATPSVTSYELVSSARAGRTTFDYTYRVRMLNDGGELLNVRGQVTSTSAAMQIIDAQITFGDVAAGAAAMSQDTFVLRQDRSVAFNPSALQWAISGEAPPPPPPPPPPPEEEFTLEPVRVTRLEVVELGGRPEHGVHEAVDGSLVSFNGPAQALVVASGSLENAALQAVNSSGAVLSSIPLTPRFAKPGGLDHVGTFTRPTVPFRLRLTGQRTGGASFEFLSRQYNVSNVYVGVLAPISWVAPGTAVQFPAQVLNLGPAATFRVTTTQAAPSSATVSPDLVTLGTGESATVTVTVQAMTPNTGDGSAVNVTVRAQTTTTPTRVNTTIARVGLEPAP
jgi:hypothetical protein